MSAEVSEPRIQLAAAKLAVTLKHVFATELKKAAAKLGKSGEALTAEDFRRAIPEATACLLKFADISCDENAQRRAA